MKLALPIAALLAASSMGVASTARADVAPPDGIKRVDYRFTVTGVTAFKDYALLAFPCGTSNGAPMDEMVLVGEDVPVSVGRRGGDCPFYAIKRADFDAWIKANPDGPNHDKAMGELFKSKLVVACGGAKPSPEHSLPETDPRDTIKQAFKVTKLDAEGCVIAAADLAPTPAPTSTPTSSPTTSPATSTTVANGPPPVTPPGGGCGCTTAATAPFGAAALASLSGIAMLVLRLRRRPAQPPEQRSSK